MTTIAEQPCYTLINVPMDAEPPTEIQLKQDLGLLFFFLFFMLIVSWLLFRGAVSRNYSHMQPLL